MLPVLGIFQCPVYRRLVLAVRHIFPQFFDTHRPQVRTLQGSADDMVHFLSVSVVVCLFLAFIHVILVGGLPPSSPQVTPAQLSDPSQNPWRTLLLLLLRCCSMFSVTQPRVMRINA